MCHEAGTEKPKLFHCHVMCTALANCSHCKIELNQYSKPCYSSVPAPCLLCIAHKGTCTSFMFLLHVPQCDLTLLWQSCGKAMGVSKGPRPPTNSYSHGEQCPNVLDQPIGFIRFFRDTMNSGQPFQLSPPPISSNLLEQLCGFVTGKDIITPRYGLTTHHLPSHLPSNFFPSCLD